MSIDAVLELYANIADGMVVYPQIVGPAPCRGAASLYGYGKYLDGGCQAWRRPPESCMKSCEGVHSAGGSRGGKGRRQAKRSVRAHCRRPCVWPYIVLSCKRSWMLACILGAAPTEVVEFLPGTGTAALVRCGPRPNRADSCIERVGSRNKMKIVFITGGDDVSSGEVGVTSASLPARC